MEDRNTSLLLGLRQKIWESSCRATTSIPTLSVPIPRDQARAFLLIRGWLFLRLWTANMAFHLGRVPCWKHSKHCKGKIKEIILVVTFTNVWMFFHNGTPVQWATGDEHDNVCSLWILWNMICKAAERHMQSQLRLGLSSQFSPPSNSQIFPLKLYLKDCLITILTFLCEYSRYCWYFYSTVYYERILLSKQLLNPHLIAAYPVI